MESPLRYPRRCGAAGRRSAFSLIELTAVLALSAILIAVGSTAFAEWRASADMKDAIDRVASGDAVVRQQTRSAGAAMELILVPATGAILRGGAAQDAEPIAIGHLPPDVRIEQMLPDPTDAGEDNLSVAISSAGRSRSYAVLLAGSAGRRQWIAVAGLTGQVVRLSDDQQAEELIGDVCPSDDAR